MKVIKRIFISHPFSGDPVGNRQKVDKICNKLSETRKILPISPLHLFSYMTDDRYRDEIMGVCYDLISICDEVWIYGESQGCRDEKRIALAQDKIIKYRY